MNDRRRARKTAGGEPEKDVKRARAKRGRNWDKSHNIEVATYRIGTQLKQEIKNLAGKLGVSPAVVVRLLLRHGLDAHKEGNLNLQE